MKRIIGTMVLFAFLILTACSSKADLPEVLSKEGVSPYELSEREKYILQSFNMEGTSQIISFNAPQEAISLNVNVYRLNDGGKWDNIGGGGISIGKDRKPVDKITGTFTMQLKENYVIDFVINTTGRASYKTEEIILDGEIMVSAKGFLREFQDITINKEMPVAFMVYNGGNTMKSYTLQDYFEPSKFEGMDLVQVVTLEFSEE